MLKIQLHQRCDMQKIIKIKTRYNLLLQKSITNCMKKTKLQDVFMDLH